MVEQQDTNIMRSPVHGDLKKKNRRRRRKNSNASDDSSSSDENSRRKSPPRQRKRNNKRSKACSVELSEQEKSRYLALDCEMVGVGYGGHRSALARVCIINWNGKKVMDDFVRSSEPVTDYRTFVSGITADDLESDQALDIDECRAKVQEILNGKILVGHALKNDLHALHIRHPWYDTRDTGKYEPFMKVRFDDGILWPRKLKELAKEKLGRDIQSCHKAHSPFEDAKTALDLYKSVRNKWEKAMDYKLNKTREIEKLRQEQTTCQVVVQLAQ